MMFVYVLDINGQPLMPTSRFGKVRRLLKEGKAKVVKSCPFIIKLLYKPETHVVQECTLGVDTGSIYIGTAVYSEGKILYQAETKIRNDIKSKMDKRRSYRKFRRCRKCRYRKARWLNRKNSIKKDRFSPTMRSKFDSHIREIEFIKTILPISILVLETGIFDPNLLNHKDEAFNRHWGYQKGPNYGFTNSKEACYNRDDYICQCCKTKKGTFNAHHIIYRSNGGADTLDNLITLCENCHKKLHRGELKAFETKLIGKKKGQLKHATQMNSIRVQLLKKYPDAIETFGAITKANREALDIPKKHYTDACIIASGGKKFMQNDIVFLKKCIPDGDFKKTRGIRSEQYIETRKIQGFRKFDKVRYLGNEYFIKGRMSTGYANLQNISGDKVDFSYMPKGWKTPKLSNLKRVSARKSPLCISQRIKIDIA